MKQDRLWRNAVLLGLVSLAVFLPRGCAADDVAGRLITLKPNGGWCWFQDERAIVDGGKIIFGSVSGTTARDWDGGDVVVTTYDTASDQITHFELHDKLERDDHNCPALLRLPDGRYLAMYAKHGSDALSRWRITTKPGDTTDWTPVRTFDNRAGATYSNLFRLSSENDGKGRLYNFGRTVGWDPNVIVSDDQGQTWSYRGRLLDWPDRPYLKYASNNVDTIHFITTDGHPRNMTNSIYHGYIRDGKVFDSSGQEVDVLDEQGLTAKTLTTVFQGSPNNVAWTTDIHLDSNSNPYIAFSVRKDGSDHRYYYGRWDGRQWKVYEVAFAGTFLYAAEMDYTGLVALDPHDPNMMVISTDADPATGQPLVSQADGQRHRELYRGVTGDGGKTWKWTPITSNSSMDNLRPVIPIWPDKRRAILWLRGKYSTYTNYDLDVVGIIEERP